MSGYNDEPGARVWIRSRGEAAEILENHFEDDGSYLVKTEVDGEQLTVSVNDCELIS